MGRNMVPLGILVECLLVAYLAMAAALNSDCHVYPYFNYGGNDITGSVILNNIYACAELCFNNTNCVAFTYQADRQCWIKTGLANPQAGPVWTTVLTGGNDCRGLSGKTSRWHDQTSTSVPRRALSDYEKELGWRNHQRTSLSLSAFVESWPPTI